MLDVRDDDDDDDADDDDDDDDDAAAAAAAADDDDDDDDDDDAPAVKIPHVTLKPLAGCHVENMTFVFSPFSHILKCRRISRPGFCAS